MVRMLAHQVGQRACFTTKTFKEEGTRQCIKSSKRRRASPHTMDTQLTSKTRQKVKCKDAKDKRAKGPHE